MLRSVLTFAISSMFLGVGLGRFAFSPLVPELVDSGWLDVGAAQSVAAANLIGYLAGALLARPALRLGSERACCLVAGLGVVLSYAMFLVPLGEVFFWVARFSAGAGAGVLMVIGAFAAGRQLVAIDRARFQPVVFAGIGLGALFAALCLPHLLAYGMEASLLALLVFSAVAMAILWANSGFLAVVRTPRLALSRNLPGPGWVGGLILLAYGCDALGFVMHTVYVPDMLRRLYGQSEAEVGFSWAFFGIGACVGPAFVMALRSRLGGLDALWVALVLKAGGVALIIASADPVTASVSLFLVGMLTPGVVILTSGALSATAARDRYIGLWAAATAIFAMGQMVGGVTIAAISGQGYRTALALSVSVLLLGATSAVAAKRLHRRPAHGLV